MQAHSRYTIDVARAMPNSIHAALVKGHFTTPKSRSSRRLLELGPRTKELLAERWRESTFQGDEGHRHIGLPQGLGQPLALGEGHGPVLVAVHDEERRTALVDVRQRARQGRLFLL